MKRKRKLIWQIFPLYLLIILVALFGISLYNSHAVKQFYLENTQEQLEAHARHFRFLLTIKEKISLEDYDKVDQLCKAVGKEISSRISIILPSGKVIGDSLEAPSRMNNHADRPEIQTALSGSIGASTRYSYTLDQEMMYVAIPISQENHVIGIVRMAVPVKTFVHTLHLLYGEIALASIIIALLAAIISLITSRHISKPLRQIRQGALRYARGELTHRTPIPDSEEIGVLAETMNQMAAQLSERIETITKQRNELEAVLTNMVEAVIIVDKDERIVRCNQAAAKLFGIAPENISLRSIQEMIRNASIQRFVKKTFEADKPIEDVLSLNFRQERFLHVHGTLLPETWDHNTEALFVFHDITRLKQLENMRKEFVANVSHELRTPITSIIGFIETLQDGAVNDQENADKFLHIIERNAQRLNSIINDLLTLSRIEQGKEGEQISLSRGRIQDVLEAAALICEKRASEHHVNIELHCSQSLQARINAALLEQAVANLMDNAIKYSNSGSAIHVSAEQQGQEVVIAVKDTGCGIPPDHLPRLFERFYRVDKARSRKLGGTGLGLAIVKHIASAHRGRATVESTPSKGSTFSIILPIKL